MASCYDAIAPLLIGGRVTRQSFVSMSNVVDRRKGTNQWQGIDVMGEKGKRKDWKVKEKEGKEIPTILKRVKG